jgi:hypothetical protein
MSILSDFFHFGLYPLPLFLALPKLLLDNRTHPFYNAGIE